PGALATPVYNMGSTGYLTSSSPVARVTGASTVMFFTYLPTQADTRIAGVTNPNQWLISTQSSQRCFHSSGGSGVSPGTRFRTDSVWMRVDLTANGTTRVLSRNVLTTSSQSVGYPSAGGTFHVGQHPADPTGRTGGYYTHISPHTAARSAAWRATEY